MSCRSPRAVCSLVLRCAVVMGSAAGFTEIVDPDLAYAAASPVVMTADGPVQGVTANGVSAFLGIPFAAPPVGALRWRPPHAPAQWTATLQTTAFGPHCPQTEIYDGFNSPSTNEDCLYLNVFAPADVKSNTRLPVMFWIYGGGFAGGESDDYDGSLLARQGHVIVVTINYRVGILGTFAHPALTAEGHLFSNYALMDQQFALRWVRQNITGFGGNPHNVTIFGESAGALSVYAQLISPLATNMFERAIAESGSFAGLFKPRNEATAEIVGEAFADQAGCSNQSAACLRALPVATLLANQGTYSDQPVIDGTLLTMPYDEAFRTGQFNRVPVINGTNLNELRWGVGQSYLGGSAETPADYLLYLSSTYGPNAAAVLARYPLAAYADPGEALAAVETDAGVSCASPILDKWLSSYVPTYAYEFHVAKPPIYLPPIAFPWGASHTTEIQFLFPGYHGGEGLKHALNRAETVLSYEMVSYWTTFARTGQPDSAAVTRWPKYRPGEQDIQFLDAPLPTTSVQFSAEHHCDFWNAVLGWPANL
jgi:para-nitrobenzyl esterase